MLRKALLFPVVLALVALALEGTARLAYRLVEHRPLDTRALDARKRQLVGEARALEVGPDRGARGTGLALHPYLGFVYDPAFDPEGMKRRHAGLPVSAFGFVDDKLPIVAPDRDQVVVGLFGGSMARVVSQEGAEALADELGRIPELRGKRIVLVRTALDGVKQPQQLMALSWLLALGARFDLIVNLDGFNEVALPPTANVKQQVFAAYPGDWAVLVGGLDDPMVTRLAGEITALVRLRGQWAELFLLPGLRETALATLLWRGVDGVLGRTTAARRLDLSEYQGQLEPNDRRFAAQGPLRRYANEAEMYDHLVALWRESSLQMHRLARANGARYYHFLQPNQYFPGAKPLGEEERRVALREGSAFGESVRQGYPRLRDAGDTLVRQGVEFHDLSGIFQGIEDPLYVDACCRVNRRGNEMTSRRIGEVIAADFADEQRRRALRAAAAAREPVAPPPAEESPPPDGLGAPAPPAGEGEGAAER